MKIFPSNEFLDWTLDVTSFVSSNSGNDELRTLYQRTLFYCGLIVTSCHISLLVSFFCPYFLYFFLLNGNLFRLLYCSSLGLQMKISQTFLFFYEFDTGCLFPCLFIFLILDLLISYNCISIQTFIRSSAMTVLSLKYLLT